VQSEFFKRLSGGNSRVHIPSSLRIVDFQHLFKLSLVNQGAIKGSSPGRFTNPFAPQNIIILGDEVKKKVERFKAVYPIGVEFKIIYNQPYFVQQKIDEFTNSLIQAIAIVIAVMLIFLGIRTGLIISSLIPMSILMSIMVMGFFNIGLDQMTIAALIISLGLLVDNAIVMSESIMVGITEGKKPVQAAIDSAKELRISLLFRKTILRD